MYTTCTQLKRKKELENSNSLILYALQDGLEPTTP